VAEKEANPEIGVPGESGDFTKEMHFRFSSSLSA